MALVRTCRHHALWALATRRTPERVRRQQAHLHSKTNDLGAGSEPELFSNSRAIRLDGFDAEEHLSRNFLTTVPLRDTFKYLALSFAEYIQ